MYIADQNNHNVREVFANRTITTFAGTGASGFSGDGGPATNATFGLLYGVATDSIGNVYISDAGNNRIRKVFANGTVVTIAGTGPGGFKGDGGPATSAELDHPQQVAVDTSGNIYISDFYNNRVRKVFTNGTISTIATNINAVGIVLDTSGNILVDDLTGHVIRKIFPNNTVTTFAGNGVSIYGGDGGPATSASLVAPHGIAIDTYGNVFIADIGNNRVRKVFTNGTITTFAGTGTGGYNGDNIAATSAEIHSPTSLAIDTFGNVYIGDIGNHRVRVVYV